LQLIRCNQTFSSGKLLGVCIFPFTGAFSGGGGTVGRIETLFQTHQNPAKKGDCPRENYSQASTNRHNELLLNPGEPGLSPKRKLHSQAPKPGWMRSYPGCGCWMYLIFPCLFSQLTSKKNVLTVDVIGGGRYLGGEMGDFSKGNIFGRVLAPRT